MRQSREIHHQILALGQKLVQWRIERTDHYRKAVHFLEQSGEIRALHGQKLRQRLAPCLLVTRQNHGLHEWDAVLGEEHVLGAAQADTFSAEPPRGLGIARDVGIGAHPEFAAKLIGPPHECGQNTGGWVSVDGAGLSRENFAG